MLHSEPSTFSSSSSSSRSQLSKRSKDISIPIPIPTRSQKFPNKDEQLSFAELGFLTISQATNQYDLAQSTTGPFHMSPPNLFMEKLQKRIDNYYSKDKGENCLSFTTRA